MPAEKNWLAVKEFAKEYGISTDRVYEWLRTGIIEALPRPTPHSFWRIPKSELERLQAKQPKISPESERVSGVTGKEQKQAFTAAHLKDMTEILHFITPQWLEGSTTEMEPPEDLTDDQLRLGFYYRLEQARMKYGDKKVACLTPHLRAYFPSLESEDIDMLLEKEPHKIYEQLWLIGQRGIDKGTCLLCKDWQ